MGLSLSGLMPVVPGTYTRRMTNPIRGVEVEIVEAEANNIRVEVVFVRGTLTIGVFRHSWCRPDSSLWYFQLQC